MSHFKMLDANGKLPASGFLEGSILSRPGSMDSCLEIDATVFRGQYCVLGKTIQNKFTGSLSKKKKYEKKKFRKNKYLELYVANQK